MRLIMGRMQIVLPDALEAKLRKKVAEKLGMKKGNISLAMQQAVEEWIRK